jgi:thioredoxin reductase (NADPH)
MADDVHDVIIVGAGPAGLAAALYSARDRCDTLILEKNGMPGGQIMLTEAVENYPGYVRVGGFDLIQEMIKQVENFGAKIQPNQAVSALRRTEDGLIELETNNGEKTFRTRALILSPGSEYRTLGVPGEEQMRQATRVSYCATCDGAFYRDKHVLAVGGGNTAVEDTVYLTRFASKITLIHRRTEFRAQKVLVEELYDKAKEHDIDIKLPYVLEEIVPDQAGGEIAHVRIRNVETDAVEELTVDGVFVFVGMIPNTGFAKGMVKMDPAGYIACDPVTLKTNVPGVWVAGDCRQDAAMQLATATADGVVAAMELRGYLKDPGTWQRQTGPEPGPGY